MTRLPAHPCERAQFLAALAPDLVLSETEERLLARHLDRCPSCCAFAASVASFTNELRAAPLAVPESSVAPVLAGARSRPRTRLKVTLAALAAAAAGVLMTSVVLHEKTAFRMRSGASPGIPARSVANDQAALQQLRSVVHARQLGPDYRQDTPGIYLG
jgi:predicted anti-sigma-YlaC factor YlaD